MKATLIIVAILAVLGHMHASPCHVAVCVIAAELTACAVLGFLIIRALRRRPILHWNTTGSEA